MLTFETLTLPQKRFVVSVIEDDKSFKDTPLITLKQCADFYDKFKSKRVGTRNERLGFPNWLNKNAVKRGVYELPLPTTKELSDYQEELHAKLNPVKKRRKSRKSREKVSVNNDTTTKKSAEADMKEFNAILLANGIEPSFN